ncbi:hypothetical protein D3C81_1412240 [compost metagenome]
MLAPSGEHCIAEVGVFPGVDHTGTLDPCRVRFWEYRGDFRKNRALGLIFLAGRNHDRHVEDLRHLGQRNRLLGGKLTVDVFDQLHRADLMVDQ